MSALDWSVPIAVFFGTTVLGATAVLTVRVVVPRWGQLGEPVEVLTCEAHWHTEVAELETQLRELGGTAALAEVDRAGGAAESLPFPDDERFHEGGARKALRAVLEPGEELSRLDCSAYPCVATVHAPEGVNPNEFRKRVETGLESAGYVLTPDGRARLFNREGKGQIYTVSLAAGALPRPLAEATRRRIDKESDQTVSDLFPVIVP